MRAPSYVLSLLAYLGFCRITSQTSPSSHYYVGAVVNYVTEWSHDLSPISNVMTNAASYSQYIRHAALQMADIIVFPEMGLRGKNGPFPMALPQPELNVRPCRQPYKWSPVLVFLACGVEDWGIYTVINVDELITDNSTKSNSTASTHLVFDRDGTVIAKYRVGTRNYTHFETDMGVRFGLMSDMDLLLGPDAEDYFKSHNVSHVALPAAVVNRLPFLTGLQMQWSWSYSGDTVLLGAGLASPPRGMSGSGLYGGRRGALDFTTQEAAASRFVLQAVPKASSDSAPRLLQYWDMPLTQTGESRRLKRGTHVQFIKKNETQKQRNSTKRGGEGAWRETLKGYKTETLPWGGPATQESPLLFTRRHRTNKTLCHKTVCCTFNLTSVTSYVPERYSRYLDEPRADDFGRGVFRLAVYDGVQEAVAGGGRLRTRRCALLPCLDTALSSCGVRPDRARPPPTRVDDPVHGELVRVATTFSALDIGASFPGRPNVLVSGRGEDFGAPPSPAQFTFTARCDASALSFRHPLHHLISAAVEDTLHTDEAPSLPYSQTWTKRL